MKMRLRLSWKKVTAFVLCLSLLLQFGGGMNGLAAEKSGGSPADASLVFDFAFGELQLDEGEGGLSVSLDSLEKINDAGMPNLPSKPVCVLLPAGMEVAGVEVEKSGVYVKKNILVEPAQGVYASPADASQDVETVYDEDIYQNGAPYPGNVWEGGSVSEVRGYRMYSLVLNPLVYQNGNLSAAKKMRVKLNLKESEISANYLPVEADEEFLPQEIENKAAVFSYYESRYMREGNYRLSGESEIIDDGRVHILGYDSVDYVIITDASLAEEFQRLADYKASKGLVSRVVNTADIYANYDGRDDAERIRNFIKTAYRENRIRYVLLGGDADSYAPVVPTRLLYCNKIDDDTTTNIASDLYFACLDGDYDGNGNDVFGEPDDGVSGGEVDLTYDVYVGRAPVDDVEEAANFVKKDIAYEERQAEGKVTLVGEVLESNSSGCSVSLASRLQKTVDAEELADDIRALRDHCIADKYVSLYYDANAFMKNVLVKDLDLLYNFSSLLVRYHGELKQYASAGKSGYVLTADDVERIREFCSSTAESVEKSSAVYDKKETIVKELNYMTSYLEDKAGCNLGSVIQNSHYYKKTKSADRSDKEKYIFGGDYMDEIKDGANTKQGSNEFVTKGFPGSYVKNTLYDRDEDNYDWDKSKVIEVMNQSPEVINHLGHCNVNYLMKCGISDIRGLENEKAFFLYSQGCYPGSFDNRDSDEGFTDDCIAEELLVSSDTSGAYACIVNSRYGWYSRNGTDGPSQAFNRYFWDRVFTADEQDRHLGAMLAQSKQYFIEYLRGYDTSDVMRFCYYEQNLLGDPETCLYRSAEKVTVSADLVKTNVGNSLTLAKGRKMTVKAFAYPLTTTDGIKWTSSNPAAVTVNKNGVLTAKKAGTAKVTATATSGEKAVVKVTVVKSVQTGAVTLNRSSLVLTRGESETLKVSISKSSKGKKWYSSNINVATVSSSGKVTAVGAGECTVYCRTASGKKAQCQVKVELADLNAGS